MLLRGIKRPKSKLPGSAYLYAVQIAPPLPFSSFELVKAQDPNRNQSQAPDDVPSETGDDGAQAKVKLTTISAAVPGLQHTGGAPAQKALAGSGAGQEVLTQVLGLKLPNEPYQRQAAFL